MVPGRGAEGRRPAEAVKVLVAMSGGVDSSVAAAMCLEAGHEVVGATMKLWGGASSSSGGCCSVADVEDARRVADQLGIAHYVFNFTREFNDWVVDPYVMEHSRGRTPNPCIECNRRIKFDRFLDRAITLGYDAVATGHHARLAREVPSGRCLLLRGKDPLKDQSYVLAVLAQRQLRHCLFPVGEMNKAEVRQHAVDIGLRTAHKPDSLDLCFVSSAVGRDGFLADRIDLHPGDLVDARTDQVIGAVSAVEMVTVGQRRGLGRGLGLGREGERRYALEVDVASRRVRVGSSEDLLTEIQPLDNLCWTSEPPPAPGTRALAQASAHGPALDCSIEPGGVRYLKPARRAAPGQTVAIYDGDIVLGSGIAAPAPA